MCKLAGPYPGETFRGFKVVAAKKDGYYSLAMGFRYEDGECVPRVKKQNRITSYFLPNIINADSDNPFGRGGYSDEMVGRTAIFEFKRDANNLRRTINLHDVFCAVSMIVVPAFVSGDLMGGSYGGASVVAGRKITFDY